MNAVSSVVWNPINGNNSINAFIIGIYQDVKDNNFITAYIVSVSKN
jgi:hypothetical protein